MRFSRVAEGDHGVHHRSAARGNPGCENAGSEQNQRGADERRGIVRIQLVPVLQTAIGPTILISGVGLLLLTMTNRLGRAIDRARILAGEIPTPTEAENAIVTAQLQILRRRARIIRLAIALAR